MSNRNSYRALLLSIILFWLCVFAAFAISTADAWTDPTKPQTTVTTIIHPDGTASYAYTTEPELSHAEKVDRIMDTLPLPVYQPYYNPYGYGYGHPYIP